MHATTMPHPHARESAHPAPPSHPAPTAPPTHIVDDAATDDERTYATFQHVVGFLSLSTSGIPLLGLIGTLIMWQVRKSVSPFLDDHGREAMNFQITLLMYTLAGTILTGVMALVPMMEEQEFFKLVVAFVIVLQLIGGIRGAKAAHRGEFYRYPMTIRVLPETSAA